MLHGGFEAEAPAPFFRPFLPPMGSPFRFFLFALALLASFFPSPRGPPLGGPLCGYHDSKMNHFPRRVLVYTKGLSLTSDKLRLLFNALAFSGPPTEAPHPFRDRAGGPLQLYLRSPPPFFGTSFIPGDVRAS